MNTTLLKKWLYRYALIVFLPVVLWIPLGCGGGGGSDDVEYTCLVIDVSTGADAEEYTVTKLETVPSDLLTNNSGESGANEYKTTKIVLTKIKPGSSFSMGSPASETARSADETQHTVTLSQEYFYFSVFEITQKQYELVMGSNPSYYPGDARPVDNVSWEDVRGGDWPDGKREPEKTSFIGKLNAKTSGYDFELPTEAEWEYACRGGTTDATYAAVDTAAWYQDNHLNTNHNEVGKKKANAYGLYDMLGNVFEWCRDWYGDYNGDETNPEGASTGIFRVIRGGGWNSTNDDCRAAARFYLSSDKQDNEYGFRIVID